MPGRALNYIKYTFNEPVIFDSNGATGGFVNELNTIGVNSSTTRGTFSSATAIAGFGSFATGATVDPNAADTTNIIKLSADGKIVTVYINVGAFNPIGLTAVGGTFTATGNAIYDLAGNQLSTTSTVPSSNIDSGWDVIRGRFLWGNVFDAADQGANGPIDNPIKFNFNEVVKLINGNTGAVIAPGTHPTEIADAFTAALKPNTTALGTGVDKDWQSNGDETLAYDDVNKTILLTSTDWTGKALDDHYIIVAETGPAIAVDLAGNIIMFNNNGRALSVDNTIVWFNF